MLTPQQLLLKLTKNVTLNQLCVTNYPEYRMVNLEYGYSMRIELKKTAIMFEYLCEMFGPLLVTSGIRCSALNEDKRVGSNSNSAHPRGEALDFKPVLEGITVMQIFEQLRKNKDFLVGQVIVYADEGFIHISRFVGRSKRDFRICRLVNGKRTYEKITVA